MARQVMCGKCKNKHDKENLIQVTTSLRLCKKCATVYNDMSKLKEYVCKLYNMEYVSPKLQKQINDYIDKHKYTAKQIHAILIYITEVAKIELDVDSENLMLVNYYRSEAKQYYSKKALIAKSAKNATKREATVIKVRQNNTKPTLKLHDISKFNVEE